MELDTRLRAPYTQRKSFISLKRIPHSLMNHRSLNFLVFSVRSRFTRRDSISFSRLFAFSAGAEENIRASFITFIHQRYDTHPPAPAETLKVGANPHAGCPVMGTFVTALYTGLNVILYAEQELFRSQLTRLPCDKKLIFERPSTVMVFNSRVRVTSDIRIRYAVLWFACVESPAFSSFK